MSAYKYPPNDIHATIGADFTKKIHTDTYPFIDSSTQSNLSKRNIFVTGATKGVGRRTALSLARAGASKIALSARSDFGSLKDDMLSAAKEAGKSAPEILLIQMDVQDTDSVQKAARLVEEQFGYLDVVLNIAGYMVAPKPVLDGDDEEWWRTWEINMRGIYTVTKALLPLLLKNNDSLKTLLNLTSSGAHLITPGFSSYQTTKLAVLRFTEFLCSEYASQGLLAYSINPGNIMTNLSSVLGEGAEKFLTDKEGLPADTMVWLIQERRVWLAGRYVSCPWDMQEFVAREKQIVERDLLKVRLTL